MVDRKKWSQSVRNRATHYVSRTVPDHPHIRASKASKTLVRLGSLVHSPRAAWISPPLRAHTLSSPLLGHHPTTQGCEELSTAAVERGPSEGARSGSKESSLHPCASPSEAARCASTNAGVLPTPVLLSASSRQRYPELQAGGVANGLTTRQVWRTLHVGVTHGGSDDNHSNH